MLKTFEAIYFLLGNCTKIFGLCFITSFFTESLMANFSLIIKSRRLKMKEEILLTFGVNLCTERWCNKTNSCGWLVQNLSRGFGWGQSLLQMTKVFLLMQCRELVTGGSPNPGEEINYFRLLVNQHQSVEKITCYTRQVSLNLSSVQLLWSKIDTLSLNCRFAFQLRCFQSLCIV